MFLSIEMLLISGILGGVISIIISIFKKENRLFKFIYGISKSLLILEIIGCIILLYLNLKPSPEIEKILETGVSKDSYVGKVIMDNDKKLEERNFDIVVDSKYSEINISIWDFAAVDGDYMELINDGKSLGEAFMINHSAKTFKVSTSGKLEIKGVKDGGGGITYALYVKETGETYFNDAPFGGFNTYTIQKK